MPRSLSAALTLLAFAAPLAAAPAPVDSGPTYIDLAPHANGKLTDNFHGDNFPGNNLGKLPTGKQTFAGVKFNVAEGFIKLGSNQTKDVPFKVEGIKVGRAVGKLHFLHACGWQGTDDQLIGKYVIFYDDDTKAEVEIVYGKDVVDWWFKAGHKAPTRSQVAWEGENEAAKANDAQLKLYLTTWENPHPKKKVVALDYVATAPEGPAAPFCVAITADQRRCAEALPVISFRGEPPGNLGVALGSASSSDSGVGNYHHGGSWNSLSLGKTVCIVAK